MKNTNPQTSTRKHSPVPAYCDPVGPEWFAAEIGDGDRVVYVSDGLPSVGGHIVGIGYHKGRMVHFIDGQSRFVSAQESLRVWAEIEHLHAGSFRDGGHDPECRAKWFRAIAEMI